MVDQLSDPGIYYRYACFLYLLIVEYLSKKAGTLLFQCAGFSFTILIWGTPIFFKKAFRKITQVVKTAGNRDFGNTIGSVTEQITADLHTVIIKKGYRGLL